MTKTILVKSPIQDVLGDDPKFMADLKSVRAGASRIGRSRRWRRDASEPESSTMTRRKLAAILAADIVGYSQLMSVDEEGTLASLSAIRREVGDPKIAEHHGRIVKTTGDGLLVEFASSVDAVRCAVELQREMADRNSSIPSGRRIAFRIGINVGDVTIVDDDIYGHGVNIAARLEGLAEPGGVCIAGRVYEDVADKLGMAFQDLGEQSLKNVGRPVRVYRVRDATPAAAPPSPAPE